MICDRAGSRRLTAWLDSVLDPSDTDSERRTG